MTYYLSSLFLEFEPSAVLNEEGHEETTKAFNLIEIEKEEDVLDEDESWIGTKIDISSHSKGNILEFLVKVGEFSFSQVSELMTNVEEY